MIKGAIAAALLLALIAGGQVYGADEAPPPQDSKIHLKKALYVHRAAGDKIFAESRKIKRGDILWNILKNDYGISDDDIPEFIEAFREVNPGVDPNRLFVGQEIRVPFKVEIDAAPPPVQAELAMEEDTYQVRSGDNLWKILRRDYGVTKAGMGRAITAVKRANPSIKDLGKLWVGQFIVIPFERHIEEEPEKAPATPTIVAGKGAPKESLSAKQGIPEGVLTILSLLEELECRVERTGERFIPLSRGRTVRLDGSDFPFITGPAGGKVILDPMNRLSAPLEEAVEASWGYTVLKGAPESVEEYLGKLFEVLKFNQLKKGSTIISLKENETLEASPRWTVTPNPDSLWEGGVHMVFSGTEGIDPILAGLLSGKGFVLHSLGESRIRQEKIKTSFKVATLPQSGSMEGAASLLSLLGVENKLSPAVVLKLDSGVSYTIRPPITFEHGSLKYAAIPKKPAKAESVLLRAGYFTFSWDGESPALGRVADLMVLLGVEHQLKELALPAEGSLRLILSGIEINNQLLLSKLYPDLVEDVEGKKIFCTDVQMGEEEAALLFREGCLPLVLE